MVYFIRLKKGIFSDRIEILRRAENEKNHEADFQKDYDNLGIDPDSGISTNNMLSPTDNLTIKKFLQIFNSCRNKISLTEAARKAYNESGMSPQLYEKAKGILRFKS